MALALLAVASTALLSFPWSSSPPAGSGNQAASPDFGSRSPDSGRDVAPPGARESATLETAETDPADALLPRTEADLLARHLKVAPTDMQLDARRIFDLQASQLEASLASLEAQSGDWDKALEELETKFALRLRQVAVQRLDRWCGLLLVDGGESYFSRIRGKKYLVAADGRQHLGRTTSLLVIIDPADEELDRIGRMYEDARDARLMEKLVPFNALPWDERSKRVRAFLAGRDAGKPDASLLGVTDRDLQWLEIEKEHLIVVPKSR